MSDSMFDALFADSDIEFTTDDAVVVLYSILAEAATSAVRARQSGDEVATAILFGRVTAAFDALVTLGVPAPAESASDVMVQAEAAVAEFDANPEAGCDGACDGSCQG